MQYHTESTEVILKENKKRFVLFPIIYHDIYTFLIQSDSTLLMNAAIAE
jgi:hypothetical protein